MDTEVITTGVDAPLSVLLSASGSTGIRRGPGLTWGAPDRTVETVRAAEQVLRTVSRLSQSVERLTAALVASQDRMAALRALVEVPIDTLDDNAALTLMLTEALELTDSDCAALQRDGALLVVGAGRKAVELGSRFDDHSPGPTTNAQPIELASGAAVIASLADATGTAKLGLARESEQPYLTGDLQLVDAVVAATEKLMTLTRMHRQEVQRATIEREHEVASTLAQATIPPVPPVLAGVDVFARTVPAHLAGGDFFAFDVLDGVLWFAVGDVAGKGLPAAIVMTRAVSAVRVAFHTHPETDPAGALGAVGDELFDYLSAVGLFVTMVVGAYRPAAGILHLCNAGHSPVITVSGRRIATVRATTPPIGVLRGVTGRTQHVPFDSQTVLALGSDGLTEQQDPNGELFGDERFRRNFVDSADLTLPEMGARLFAEVSRYAHGTTPSDDRTLVLLRGTM